MDADWINTMMARRVLEHWADARPAWLWSGDGSQMLWRNPAARCFAHNYKRTGTRPNPEAVPIKGQITRLLRLGSTGRNSLSRIQFLVGQKPVSATCVYTPLTGADGQPMMLIVGADPIAGESLNEAQPDALTLSLLPANSQYLLINEDGQVASGSDDALERYRPLVEGQGLPAFDSNGTARLDAGDAATLLRRFRASPGDALLVLFEPDRTPHSAPEPANGSAPGEDDLLPSQPAIDLAEEDEPAFLAEEPAEPDAVPPESGRWSQADAELAESWSEAVPEPAAEEPVGKEPDVDDGDRRSLTALFDRLVGDEQLFTPLTAADDEVPQGARVIEQPMQEPSAVEPVEEAVAIETIVEAEAEAEEAAAEPEEDVAGPVDVPRSSGTLYRIIGRRFVPDEAGEALVPAAMGAAEEDFAAEIDDVSVAEDDVGKQPVADEPDEAFEDEPVAEEIAQDLLDDMGEGEQPPTDSDSVERISRYNFDELSRILNDRIGNGDSQRRDAAGETDRQTAGDKALVTLGGETFVLNRLPLGLLVFRDQQVLFANRALVDLVGYDSIDNLRAAGLAAIFPAADSAGSGPLNHLVRRDGTLAQVNARLQSISWQGRSALMLSASAAEPSMGHEVAVRSFAEILADVSEEGFIGADRAGTVTDVSGHATILFGMPQSEIVGRAVSSLVVREDVSALRDFLEKPARFAETARPGIALSTQNNACEILLFAQGQAGIVTGYFGFVRRRVQQGYVPAAISAPPPPPTKPEDRLEPGLLTRISRGIRRPLNTIVGFADMLGAAQPEDLDEARRKEYARDIRRAGQEVALLVDELDDFARLKEGRYAAQHDDRDLSVLLEISMARLRALANDRRVLVRSAISERLPRIKADLPSLSQALLNLIASAIDHTPAGGQVVVSANWLEEGGIAIHVRDGAELDSDLSERFVVFRDGIGKDGEPRQPVRSSLGLSLTRALLAINSATLSVEPTAAMGTLFIIALPADLIVEDAGAKGRV